MKNKKKGFTLIEIIVVMGVFAILLPTVFGVIYIIMQQQLRVHKLTETKKQGDLIMNYMKESIAGTAIRIIDGSYSPQCETAGGSFDNTSDQFNFTIEEATFPDLISFTENSGALSFDRHTYAPLIGAYVINSINLNDPATVEISNFVIECFRRNADLQNVVFHPIVSFSYDATFVDNTPTLQEGVVSLHYQTKVKLRRTPD